jgi:hypothetical protein
MLHKHIARLKELVVSAEDLAEPVRYFLDHVAAAPAIRRANELGNPTFLGQIIQGVATLHFEAAMPLASPMFFQVAEYGLWHGACRLGGRITQVLYFEDIGVGIVAIAYMPAAEQVDFLRFSVIRGGTEPRDRN